jgi:4-alpha-glucanotransferase
VNFQKAASYKTALFKTAFESNKEDIIEDKDFNKFCIDNEYWLEDYCLYSSIKDKSNCDTWRDFPLDLRDRKHESLMEWSEKEQNFVLYNKFLQYIFFKQWTSLKKYANDSGIRIIGDLPYYINYDSSDVWANQEIFKLDIDKNPEFISGVPPDYFSKTGQLWGNPVYDWDKLKQSDYSWWISRIGHNLSMVDKLRLDHFRAFVSYWEVNAEEKTALNGKWVDLDSEDFLDALFSNFDKSKFIAEDLGLITEDVKEIIKHYDLPGMKILLFAFGGDFPYGDYLPSNIDSNCIVYTGTHDNNTVSAWWNEEASDMEKKRVCEYFGRKIDEDKVNWEFIELAYESRADTVIIPMQDILGLGASSRMNTPSTTKGNWTWTMKPGEFFEEMVEKLKVLSEYNKRV